MERADGPKGRTADGASLPGRGPPDKAIEERPAPASRGAEKGPPAGWPASQPPFGRDSALCGDRPCATGSEMALAKQAGAGPAVCSPGGDAHGTPATAPSPAPPPAGGAGDPGLERGPAFRAPGLRMDAAGPGWGSPPREGPGAAAIAPRVEGKAATALLGALPGGACPMTQVPAQPLEGGRTWPCGAGEGRPPRGVPCH
jgi:hypothetical protein